MTGEQREHLKPSEENPMPALEPDHECDLFLLSSHRAYLADRILPEFARQGCRNIHGWGLGTYSERRALVVRRSDPATDGQSLGREFATAVEAIIGSTILGHLRLTSRGRTRPENNHPFVLNFLGYDWLLIHNGSARNHELLVPRSERLLVESDSDTPRVFEFLRAKIIDRYHSSLKTSLIESCRAAFRSLLDADDGTFNIVLSNGHLSFVFIHWRPFFALRRDKESGDTALVSTLCLTPNEEWVKFNVLRGKRAKMLVFSGPMLVLNGDIA
jgi:predicted glutamine amidotransferase